VGTIKEFILFMLFSSLESLALVIVVLTMFRFKLSECWGHAVFVVLIMALQSFFFRVESLDNLVPFVNSIIIALLLTSVLSVPIQWGLFAAIGGYMTSVILQAIIIQISFGAFALETIKDSPWRGYLLQFIFSAIAIWLSKYLYSRGIGFSFDFEKKRFKWERAIVISLIVITLAVFGIILYIQNVLVVLVVMSIAMAFFLTLMVKKEVGK